MKLSIIKYSHINIVYTCSVAINCEEELSKYFTVDTFILLNSDIKRLFPTDS